MKTISLDVKSLAIGLISGLLMVSLIAASQQTEEPVAKYQMALAEAGKGVVLDTQTGQLFTFQLEYPYEKSLQAQVLQIWWQTHGETNQRKGPTPKLTTTTPR